MGRYRSDDSDDDRDRKYKKKSKKRRARSRSGSDSGGSYASSSRVKKSKKKHARSSRSPSPNRGYSSRRSRSRSRSASYDRYYGSQRSRKSRSPSSRKGRRSRSRSKSKSYRRRSRSYSRERRSRSASGTRSSSRNHSRRSSPEVKSDTSSALKSRMSLTDQSRSSPTTSHLTPAQQAEERMRQALKAAAAADEKLRQLPSSDTDPGKAVPDLSLQPKFSSYEESQSFANSVAAIDSGNFKQAAFKSSRNVKPQQTAGLDLGPSHDDAIFGSLAVTGFTIKPDPDTKPLELDSESIIHPSLFCNADEKLDMWIERLTQLRKRKLEGDAL